MRKLTPEYYAQAYMGFQAVYNDAFEGAPSVHETISMRVNSTTAEETYAWLGQFPGLREWLGQRVIKSLSGSGFTVRNRDWESTIAVGRNEFEDEKLGVYKPMFAEMGRVGKQHPDQMLFSLLASGFATLGYDKVPFFSAEHVRGELPKQQVKVSNLQPGPGEAWYLLDLSRNIKPLIWQVRKDYELESLIDPKSDHVFKNNEFLFGVRARVNAGLGLWQLAFASKAELNMENYIAARNAMTAIRGDQGGSVAKFVVFAEHLPMTDFKGRHFEGVVILWAVRWYCRYGVSYRDLETMLGERGVSVDHSTIYRWVQRYAPEMEKRLRWYWKRPMSSGSWRVDETYVKVKGRWTYLYRAIDKDGDTIDFYLSPTRNAKAAQRFLGKALAGLKDWEKPETINTDKAPTYGIAIHDLKAAGKLPEETVHRQVKYLNNVIEADHGKLKQLIRPVRGFKTLKTAYATIRGFEVMRALRKGQAVLWQYGDGIMGEVRLIERQFGIYTA